jgi:hypothetical protein
VKPRISQLDQSGAADGDVITWDDTAGEWVPAAGGGGGSLDDLTDVATTGVADGDVLTYDSGSGPWVPAAPSGGGGGGSSLVTVDDPSLWGTDLGYDYEFDANNTSTLPTGWSWLNQGTATYLERFGGGAVSVTGAGSYNSRGLIRGVPAGSSWAATFKIGYSFPGSGAASAEFGVMLRDSASSKLVQYSRFSSGYFGLELANSPASFNSNASLVQTAWEPQGALYMRIVKSSSTSYAFGVSPDGCAWTDTITGYDPSGFLTPTDIGFFLNSSITTQTGSVACHWLRVR